MYFGIFDEGREAQDFKAIQIRLASPEAIRSWSHGEVTLPETINYRSFKPEKGGLFCERIFGPVKDWECNCGKYRRIRYRGMICENCGVEVTQSKVRRERLGHIELAVPVAHVWFFRGNPNIIGRLLDMKRRDLERVLYYESYIVLDPGSTDLKIGELLSGERMAEYSQDPESGLRAVMGAGAIMELFEKVDVETSYHELRALVRDPSATKQAKKKALKRLQVFDAFRGSGNEPVWTIMDVIPVLPPDLRPLVPLEGGRFATSDLNDLYRRVIYRNNRLKSLLKIKAPEIILRNEKRMLQQAVDALFDNGRGSRAVRGRGRRVLKSLSHLLKGKKGRFRQNLLGKRVDYSGRSVIVVGPELKLHQCGIPKTMALELFSPFIVRRLQELDHAQTVKAAKNLIERKSPEVWDALEDVITDHPIFLNRAPTLHRLGIQAFEPILVEGKAIRIHPLVCTAFNADFDGDQMAVHVPLSFEAQIESRVLMMSTNNILLPANGKPVASPSQDIVLGCYYLTKSVAWSPEEAEKVHAFADTDEVVFALDQGRVDLHEWIKVRVQGRTRVTTPGRVIFNAIIPDELGYVNQCLDVGKLRNLVMKCHRVLGQAKTAEVLDNLKDLGFHYATVAGITISVDDVVVPDDKREILASAETEVARIRKYYHDGVITDAERYNRVVDTWTHAAGDVADAMAVALEGDSGGFNPIHMMADSGARGSKDQIRQLAGMRGLMAKPQKKLTGQMGEIIESPIRSNFREGLTALEYFISTHGARKGLADTALKTADAGYLTRRLVDVAQEVVVSEYDCGTARGITSTPLTEAGKIVEPLHERVLGRVAAEDVLDPATDEVIIKRNQLIDEEATERLRDMNVEKVRIRSVLTCESSHGVCAMCYGRNLATGRMVEIGEVVGIVAAQSIGEPGTQLTLRTFHIGGTSARIAEVSKREAGASGTVAYGFDKSSNVRTDSDGNPVMIGRSARLTIDGDDGRTRAYNVPYGAVLRVAEGDHVEEGETLFEWDPYNDPIIARSGGTVKFIEVEEGRTMERVADEATGHRERVVVEDPEKDLHPSLVVMSKSGKSVGEYILPTGARIFVGNGDAINAGTVLAKIQREFGKTRDITGGLPRVEELFEARPPKNPATVSEIDGVVSFGAVKKGMREITITGEGIDKTYKLPHGTHLRVHDGDSVKAGDRLSEGPINPHDILAIKGEKAVQEYLLNEIQEVYRLQGVKINDKHIAMIVRQMLQRVRVVDPGDTKFLEDDVVSRSDFEAENRRVNEENKAIKEKDKKLQPAQHEPLLLGITKAALTTDSFISAASFQETTRVLMMAATRGSVDTLRGLKENVIIGRRIPAGTGLEEYDAVSVTKPEPPKPRVVERPDEAPEGDVGMITSAGS